MHKIELITEYAENLNWTFIIFAILKIFFLLL